MRRGTRILVTGATGFIGRHLVSRLATDGHEVIAHGWTTRLRWNGKAVSTVYGDLTQPEGTRQLPRQVDAIVHLAQSPLFRQFPERAPEVLAVNVVATLNVLDYARRCGARRFVFASSGNVYGGRTAPIDENSAVDPHDFYGATKAAAEAVVAQYSQYFDTVILRLFAPYGAGQPPDRLVPRLVSAVGRREAVRVDAEGGFRITPTHVDDVVDTIDRSLELCGRHCINVGGREALSIRDMAGIIAGILGVDPVLATAGGRLRPHLVPDIARMRALFPPLPRVAFAEGIRRFVTASGKAPVVAAGR